MLHKRLLVFMAFAVAFGGLACGSHPIPTVAVSGTTISVMVPAPFASALGRTISMAMDRSAVIPQRPADPPYDPASILEDVQRGELLFLLRDGLDNLITYLPVAYITRVHIDEAARIAALAAGEEGNPASYAGGQLMALPDIPPNVPTGDYSIEVQRWVRSEADPDVFVQNQPQLGEGDWIGWGTPSSQAGIPIRIVNDGGAQKFTPKTGFSNFFGNYAWQNVSGDLNSIVPRPKVRVLVLDMPAALDFEMEYPQQNVEILGVEVTMNRRSNAMVLWEADPPTSCSSPGTGVPRVHFVDPQQRTAELQVIYKVHNFDDACGKRLAVSDFVVRPESVKAYDRDGVELVDSTDPMPVDVSG